MWHSIAAIRTLKEREDYHQKLVIKTILNVLHGTCSLFKITINYGQIKSAAILLFNLCGLIGWISHSSQIDPARAEHKQKKMWKNPSREKKRNRRIFLICWNTRLIIIVRYNSSQRHDFNEISIDFLGNKAVAVKRKRKIKHGLYKLINCHALLHLWNRQHTMLISMHEKMLNPRYWTCPMKRQTMKPNQTTTTSRGGPNILSKMIKID